MQNVMDKVFEPLMATAVARWKETKGEGMTSRDLELARAAYQDRRNSRQVRKINELLRERIRKVIVNAITRHYRNEQEGK